jgi:eukaryotic-like serine/threonine-protein kinase
VESGRVITERFVLPADAEVMPVNDVAAEVRARFTHRPGDYVISRASGRAGTHVVDASSAGLLERFRGGTTISDAVIAFSRQADADPERVLTDVWPVLQKLIRANVLVPEQADMAPMLSIGQRLDDWTAIRCVYLLEDTELWQVRDDAGRWHALKLARSTRDAVILERFRRETTILTALGGRVGPRLTGRGADYLVVEWCPGSDVETVAAEYRGWADGAGRGALWQLVVRIVDAYVSLHAAGVLHGDVHPGNLLADGDGQITILDFAFARHVSDGDDAVPRGGVPFYYDPELARAIVGGGELPSTTAAGEQFAIAAVVYRLLTGTHYRQFPLDRTAFWKAIAEDAPRAFAAAGVAPWPRVEAVLARALAKAPGDRYPSVAAFATALREAGDAPATRIDRPAPSERARALLNTVLARVAHDDAEAGALAEVMAGMGGVAYMLYRVAVGRGDPALLALADVWAERARSGAASPETDESCSPANPYHMMSGVHVVRALIAHAAGDAWSWDRAINAFVGTSAVDHVDPDLTLGTAGVLLASAMLLETGQKHDVLQAHGASVYADLSQHLESSMPRSSGVAHGWAGVLFALLRWCEVTGTRPAPVVGRRLTELATCAEPRGRGVRWPWHLAGPDRVYAPGWCNGTAGMVPMWTLAATVMREPAFDELADRSAWHSWERSGSSADLCCGDTGIAYALLARYRATGDVAWYRRAQSLAEHAVLRIGEEQSFFRGDVGVALLVAELDWPGDACMPFFGHEGWPPLAGGKASGGY